MSSNISSVALAQCEKQMSTYLFERQLTNKSMAHTAVISLPICQQQYTAHGSASAVSALLRKIAAVPDARASTSFSAGSMLRIRPTLVPDHTGATLKLPSFLALATWLLSLSASSSCATPLTSVEHQCKWWAGCILCGQSLHLQSAVSRGSIH